uniref:root allergen protein-like n=1 Tax=Erigeron canadensis TaxID=72917 RepID=UPI001CB8D312|nr:root allergen protein-like [Erigeron canadensis]
MAVVTAEIEVPCSVPAPKLFKLFSDFENIAPKAAPQVFKSVTTIQGDGIGSVNKVTYSDGIPYNTSNNRLDAVDTDNLSLTYTIIDGDILMGILDEANHHCQFIPSDNGGSIFKQKMTFKCKGDSKLSEEHVKIAKEANTKTIKAFEAYANAHPEVC